VDADTNEYGDGHNHSYGDANAASAGVAGTGTIAGIAGFEVDFRNKANASAHGHRNTCS
jgi:hypothetical protein